jgi:hypothetical protein
MLSAQQNLAAETAQKLTKDEERSRIPGRITAMLMPP